MDDPQLFLVHDMQFHRAVAVASRNPIVASLIEMVSTLFFEHRRPTAARATDRNLRDAANMHRRIYLAIRERDAGQARTLMDDHLRQAAMHHAEEAQDPVRPVAARPAEARRRRNA
jgi:GntR family transcriptional repressor for pyruvate dehydrogenase complex